MFPGTRQRLSSFTALVTLVVLGIEIPIFAGVDPQACCQAGVCTDLPSEDCPGLPQGTGTTCATTQCPANVPAVGEVLQTSSPLSPLRQDTLTARETALDHANPNQLATEGTRRATTVHTTAVATAISCVSDDDCLDGCDGTILLGGCFCDNGQCRCKSSQDCNDGRFCNGTERCASASCESRCPPCLALEICNEDHDRCEFSHSQVTVDSSELFHLCGEPWTGFGDASLLSSRHLRALTILFSISDDIPVDRDVRFASDDLVITGAESTRIILQEPHGRLFVDGDRNVLRNLTITNEHLGVVRISGDDGVIDRVTFYGVTFNVLGNNRRIIDSVFTNGHGGIIQGSSLAVEGSNTEITRCTFEGWPFSGIYVRSVYNPGLTNTLIHDCIFRACYQAILIGSGSGYTEIWNNAFYDNLVGIEAFTSGLQAPATVWIHDNFFQGCLPAVCEDAALHKHVQIAIAFGGTVPPRVVQIGPNNTIRDSTFGVRMDQAIVMGNTFIDNATAVDIAHYGWGATVSQNRIGGGTTGIVVGGSMNHVQGNVVGESSAGAPLPTTNGVVIIPDELGLHYGIARANVVGRDANGDGSFNTIVNSREDAIVVEPRALATIRQNVITQNGGRGINVVAPAAVEPPAVVVWRERNLVLGEAVAPDGSLVDIYADPEDEGKSYLGTTTLADGKFLWLGNLPAENITATVTTPEGTTSAFSCVPDYTPTDPGTNFDLSIHSVEWGQTLFRNAARHPFKLVIGKSFFVRVFVQRAGTPSDADPDWDVVLHLYFDGDPPEVRTLGSIGGPRETPAFGQKGPNRENEDDSFNFLVRLTDAEIAALQKIVAEVNPCTTPRREISSPDPMQPVKQSATYARVPESIFSKASNTREVSKAELQFVDPVYAPTIIQVPVDRGDGLCLRPGFLSVTMLLRYLQVYPVGVRQVLDRFIIDRYPVDCSTCVNEPRFDLCCINKLALRARSHRASVRRIQGWYAVSPDDGCTGAATACAWEPDFCSDKLYRECATVGVQSSDSMTGQFVAHELGHTYLGQGHNGPEVPTTGQCGVDPTVGEIGDDDIGVDVYSFGVPYLINNVPRVSPPGPRCSPPNPLCPNYMGQNRASLMRKCVYGSDYHWIKKSEYTGLLDRLTLPAASRVHNETARGLMLLGTWDDTTNSTTLEPALLVEGEETGPFLPDGTHLVRLFSATNGELPFHQEYFSPWTTVSDGDHPSEQDNLHLFQLVVPESTGAGKELVHRIEIALSSTGQVLATRTRSPNPPEVAFVTPQQGEVLGKEISVDWSTSDQDGDPVLCSLDYMRANAGVVTPIVSMSSRSDVVIRRAELPGSAPGGASFRLTCTDGMNTTVAEVSGLNNADRKSPEMALLVPANGSVALEGAPILAAVAAIDPEDGALSDDRIVWDSSLDGFLGNGVETLLTRLSVGMHTLTVSATDSDGMMGSDSVTIEVRSRNACDRSPIATKADVGALGSCVSGPEASLSNGCECYDYDRNRQIDLRDIAHFQQRSVVP